MDRRSQKPRSESISAVPVGEVWSGLNLRFVAAGGTIRSVIEWLRRVDPDRPFLVAEERTWSYGQALDEAEARLTSTPRIVKPSLQPDSVFDLVAGLGGAPRPRCRRQLAVGNAAASCRGPLHSRASGLQRGFDHPAA